MFLGDGSLARVVPIASQAAPEETDPVARHRCCSVPPLDDEAVVGIRLLSSKLDKLSEQHMRSERSIEKMLHEHMLSMERAVQQSGSVDETSNGILSAVDIHAGTAGPDPAMVKQANGVHPEPEAMPKRIDPGEPKKDGAKPTANGEQDTPQPAKKQIIKTAEPELVAELAPSTTFGFLSGGISGAFKKIEMMLASPLAQENAKLEDKNRIKWNEELARLTCPRRYNRMLARAKIFEAITTVLIIANAAIIGAQTEWTVQNIGSDLPSAYRTMDLFFTVYFTIELSIRIIDEARFFLSWYNEDLKWNLFDSFIVGMALLEELFVGGPVDASGMRALRVLRLARLLRVVRVMRFFRDLRIMVAGIVSSLKSLVWCFILLLMIKFMFSLVILQVITEELLARYEDGTLETDEAAAKLLFHFGSMLRSIYTLFLTITGGVDWGEVAQMLVNIQPFMGLAFMAYIGFCLLCVFNIVTCVFVDKANSFTKTDVDNMVIEELSNRQQWIEEMRGILSNADSDGTDTLNRDEFVEYISDTRVQAYFRNIGLNVEKDNAMALFKLIDLDDSGTVTLEEFVEGCAQFVGNARQLDIARAQHELRHCSKQMKEMPEFIKAEFHSLSSSLTGSFKKYAEIKSAAVQQISSHREMSAPHFAQVSRAMPPVPPQHGDASQSMQSSCPPKAQATDDELVATPKAYAPQLEAGRFTIEVAHPTSSSSTQDTRTPEAHFAGEQNMPNLIMLLE